MNSSREMTTPTKICILQAKPIEQEIREILSNPLIFPHIYYLEGSPISRKTLISLEIEKYQSALILANKETTNEERMEEDSKNILKYWSIKNYCPKLKVYIQILTQSMKKTIMNMPNPEYVNSDSVVCIEELRSSFFAQNCLYSGKILFFNILFIIIFNLNLFLIFILFFYLLLFYFISF